MGLFGVKKRGLPETQTVQFEIWGQRGWHNVEVVGESHHAREIRALIPSRDLGDGTEVIVPVSVVHTRNNPHDRNAVEVRAVTGLVGFLSREDAVRYAPVLEAVQQGGRTASTSARVWGSDQENWDSGKKEFAASIRLDLPEPHLLIPANHPPVGPHQILPVGSAIQVTGEENHLPAILPYLNSDGECWIHATLHLVVEEGSRSSKNLAEVRIDGNTVGRLTPKMSSDLLPAVSYLAELGQATCVRAIVKGNRLKAEVVLYALRAHELPADLEMLASQRNPRRLRQRNPQCLLRCHPPTGMPTLATSPDSGTGTAPNGPSTSRLDRDASSCSMVGSTANVFARRSTSATPGRLCGRSR